MRTEDAGILIRPGDGEALGNPIGGRMVVKIRDEHTDGSFSVHDNTIPRGLPVPDLTSTATTRETFYVLEGELTVQVGPRTFTAPAGSFVVVPRGVVHQPSNPGTEPTRMLLIFSPTGMDHFFEEAAEGSIPLQAAPTDPAVQQKLEAFTNKYAYEFAEFPTG